MRIVNTHEAKTHLSRLLDQVAAGEEVVIAKAGKPIARLVAYSPSCSTREGGQWRGRVRIADDFDAPLPREIEDSFTDPA